jgi:type I restriction enzyme S subunit
MSEFQLLGAHISIQKGKPPRSIPFHGNGAEIYLNPEYLRNRTDGVSAKADSDAVRVEDGETVLLWDGSNAGEFFKAKKGLVASTMARIAPDAAFYPGFFFHLLKHAEAVLKSQTNGTGIPHVDKEILENITVFCPSDEQQRKIAEVLDTLDTTIHQTGAIVEKLKRVKQGLLHDLLTRGVDANGELRSSYEEAAELYQESPCGLIPKTWRSLGLAEFQPETRSVIRTGPFGSSLKGEHWRDSGRAVVTIGSLGIGKFIDDELLFVDEFTARRLSEYELISGDIAFSRVADVGR